MIERSKYSANRELSQIGTPFDTSGDEKNFRHERFRVMPSEFCMWNMPVRFTLIRDIYPNSDNEF